MTDTNRQDDYDRGEPLRRHDDLRSTTRLAPLSDLEDYEVADHTSDPRGWTVMDAVQTDIGKVHDLIVDREEMRTRYIDVELDKHAARLKDERHVLVPVALAQLDDDRHRVVLASLLATQIIALPAFTHEPIDDAYERTIAPNFESTPATPPRTSDATAASPARAETNIRRRDEPRAVTEPPTASQDEIVVERRPVSRADSAAPRETDGDEIRIPVYEDEIVVNKRRVLKEEIVVRKSAVQSDKGTDTDNRPGNP